MNAGDHPDGAKAPAARGTRKPPAAADSHAVIETWLARVMPDLHPVVREVDELICRTIPGLRFAIKWRKAYYGLPQQGWIIEIAAYDVSVNVVFLGGAAFEEPPPLGDRGPARYVKLRTVEEAREPRVRTWIEQTQRGPGWK